MSENGGGIAGQLKGFGTAEARWARLGPYYAMFPVVFACEVIEAFSQPGDTVVDPFCGRGTAPYVAMVSGREAAGCDVNPVAWVYTAAKTTPHVCGNDVDRRIGDIYRGVRRSDRKADNEFQALAFGTRALGFINAARRELQWRDSTVDLTVAALLIHYLHAKLGQGLSNQMRPSKATSPAYSIRWWRSKGLSAPPDVDPVAFLRKRAAWRYAKGIPARSGAAVVLLGDAAEELPSLSQKADLVLTSPPYVGVTNYRVDNWLRLWALGEGPPLPDWSTAEKYVSPAKYESMLSRVLGSALDLAHEETVWWLRVDARQRTLSVVRRVMDDFLPDHGRYQRMSPPPGRTQTSLYGNPASRPGDIDLVYLPPICKRDMTSSGIELELVDDS